MSQRTPVELKQALRSRGFEVYRIHGARVVLAERVRENLILDSGVSGSMDGSMIVRFVVRARAGQFPGQGPAELLARARDIARPGLAEGFIEVEQREEPIWSPAEPSQKLDVTYEVAFEKTAASEQDFWDLLRFALTLRRDLA
jgi:hypothetical protein